MSPCGYATGSNDTHIRALHKLRSSVDPVLHSQLVGLCLYISYVFVNALCFAVCLYKLWPKNCHPYLLSAP